MDKQEIVLIYMSSSRYSNRSMLFLFCSHIIFTVFAEIKSIYHIFYELKWRTIY